MNDNYTYKWFALAVLSLGLGGGFAFIVAMSRTPFGYKYLPSDYMYHAITGHVILAILIWLLSFTVVLWSVVFQKKGWDNSYLISFAGVLLVTFSALFSSGKAVSNNYVPTLIDPVFFIGLALFFTGFVMNVYSYFKSAVIYIRSKDIVLNTVSISVLIAVIMILAMLYSLVFHRAAAEPFIFYERLFWAAGHIQQILNGSLLIVVWYSLLRIVNKEIRHWHFLRYANLMLILSALVFFFLQIIVDPVDRSSRISADIIYATGLGIPIFLHIANIIRELWRGGVGINPPMPPLKKRGGFSPSVASISLILSMSIYTIGVLIAYSGFGNDLRVPAHYHGAVTGLTLGLMGFSYHLVKKDLLSVKGNRIEKFQALLYGSGMILFIIGLFISGAFGAPRKTYGVSFTTNPVILTSLAVMGIGTIMAVSSGVLFVGYITRALVKLKR